MPLYEYKCKDKDCAQALEVVQKITAEPLTTCPKCEQETLVKQLSVGGFNLKGTGWYKGGIN